MNLQPMKRRINRVRYVVFTHDNALLVGVYAILAVLAVSLL